jgi:hypothetical protein
MKGKDANVELLAALRDALPDMQRHGVRRLQLGPLTVEIDRVDPLAVFDENGQPIAVEARSTLPTQPPPGETDDLDTAAVDDV